MAHRKSMNTKLEILQCATELFLEEGYTAAYITTIAKKLGISTGNLTFYFPTKEHLLAELVRELCMFQWQVMDQEVTEGKSSLVAYLLELATMTSIVKENPIAKDLYTSAYIHSLPLQIIRENDTQKAARVFQDYCPDWKESDFRLAENVVSGIEYSMFMEENAEDIPLDARIAAGLDAVLKIYGLPEELRRSKVEKVLSMDYRAIGRRILQDFMKYVENKNAQALEAAARQKGRD